MSIQVTIFSVLFYMASMAYGVPNPVNIPAEQIVISAERYHQDVKQSPNELKTSEADIYIYNLKNLVLQEYHDPRGHSVNITAISLGPALETEDQVDALMVLYRLSGFVAREVLDSAYGRIAYAAILKALGLEPQNKQVVVEYGKLILEFKKKNSLVRKILEYKLNIELSDCINFAVRHLLPFRGEPEIATLIEKLQD
jgi:hypothetical protein